MDISETRTSKTAKNFNVTL